MIARSYLAAMMPDVRYRQTTALLDVQGHAFRAAGRQPIELGWRAAFPDWQPAEEKGDEALGRDRTQDPLRQQGGGAEAWGTLSQWRLVWTSRFRSRSIPAKRLALIPCSLDDEDGTGPSAVDRRKAYTDAHASFDKSIQRAARLSAGASGVRSPSDQHYWASVLFTRLVVTAMSVRKLLPDWKASSHWDFSAVASITRNLAECYLFYFFLCIDDVPQVEKDARIILLNLHDAGTRGRLMDEIDDKEPDEETAKAKTAVHDDLVAKFNVNSYLASLPKKRRKELLKGEKTPFVQDDVIDCTALDKRQFRMLYRLFSAHTHTGPISFYRMAEHGRGHGVANLHDAKYITYAMLFATELIDLAGNDLLTLFPDADERGVKIKSEETHTRGSFIRSGKR